MIVRFFFLFVLLFFSVSGKTQISLDKLSFDKYENRDAGLIGRDFVAASVDHNGNYWIAARDGSGLFRFDGYEFRHFNTSAFSETRVSDNSMRFVYTDKKGFIWASTRFGLNRLDPYTLEFTHYFHDEEDSNSLTGNYLEPVFEDEEGNIFIGATNGLNWYDRESDSFTQFKAPEINGNRRLNLFMQIRQDKTSKDHLILSSSAGVRRFDKIEKDFEDIPLDVAINRFPKGALYSVFGQYQLDNGDLYFAIGGLNNFAEYIVESDTWNVYSPFGENLNIYQNFAVYDFLKYDDDHIWVSGCTGMFLFNTKTKTLVKLPMDKANKNHPISSVTRFLNSDHNGKLLLPSLLGFSVSHQIDLAPRCELGTRYIGINYIQIGNRKVYSEIQNSYNKGELPVYRSNITLVENRDIIFNFSLPNPIDKNDVKYEYKLKGRSSGWVDNGNSNKLHIKEFSGGNYALNIRAKENENSEWIYSPELKFTIQYYFFQTIWFKLILAAIGIGVIMMIYRMKVSHIRKEAELTNKFNQQLAEVEMEALRAQMNPHFLFNTMNSINHFILRNESDEASAYLTKFSRLVRQTLNNSKEKLVTLEDEINVLNLYLELEQLRFQKKFEFNINVDENVSMSLRVPPMIIQPFIENAIWHGLMHKEESGNINLNFFREADHIAISIKDDGIGREKAKEYKSDYGTKKKSYGLQITQSRLDLVKKIYKMDADIEINDLYTNGIASGTEVVVHIPIL